MTAPLKPHDIVAALRHLEQTMQGPWAAIGAHETCRDAADLIDNLTGASADPALAGCVGMVLYFQNEKERDNFIELVRSAKPTLITRSL